MGFIYSKVPDFETLQQGDLIERSPEVDAILREVHPHYLKDDYRHFLIITQSCDLVVREGQFAASYISISAVRPLERAVERFAGKLMRTQLERDLRFCSDERRVKLEQFCSRLLNNNEDEYFYLPQSAEHGLVTDDCAFLKLSIALKGALHYETLLKAKRAQLTDSFQHKLGWLVGSSYSRVGTEDWSPKHEPIEAFEQRARATSQLVGITWIPKQMFKPFSAAIGALPEGERTTAKLRDVLKSVEDPRARRRADILDSIKRVALDLKIEENVATRLRKRLESDAKFASLLKLGTA